MFLSHVSVHGWQILLSLWKATEGTAVPHSYLLAAVTAFAAVKAAPKPAGKRNKTYRPGRCGLWGNTLNLQRGIFWPWSNPSGIAKVLVTLERKAFLSEKLARERKTVKLKVWHLLLALFFHYLRIFTNLQLTLYVLPVPLSLAAVRQMKLKGNASILSLSGPIIYKYNVHVTLWQLWTPTRPKKFCATSRSRKKQTSARSHMKGSAITDSEDMTEWDVPFRSILLSLVPSLMAIMTSLGWHA